MAFYPYSDIRFGPPTVGPSRSFTGFVNFFGAFESSGYIYAAPSARVVADAAIQDETEGRAARAPSL